MSNLKSRILEENFFRPKWYSVLLNPYFINRFSLFSEIKKFALLTPPDATILDVGCGIKPYRQLFKSATYTGIDIAGGKSAMAGEPGEEGSVGDAAGDLCCLKVIG